MIRVQSGLNYKLTETQLRGFIPAADADRIIAANKTRKPNKWAERIERFNLNHAKSVWVQNVQFYGGEDFGEPYYFVAELRYATTRSALSRCINRLGLQWLWRLIPFTY